MIFFFLAPLRLLKGLAFLGNGKGMQTQTAWCLWSVELKDLNKNDVVGELEAGEYISLLALSGPRWSLQRPCHMSGILSFRISRDFEMCHGCKSEVASTLKPKPIRGTPPPLQQQVFLPEVYGSCKTPVTVLRSCKY